MSALSPGRAALFLAQCIVLLGLCSCGSTAREGGEAAECGDRADNDSDGAFDCADTDCATSDLCAGAGDDDTGD
ncbi:MAG TPA: hypothetical protein DIU15_19070, partial [Deltaproteobacteria bacterium]|nr:hypothetical protein [Deltaproteobacteria bacterium]